MGWMAHWVAASDCAKILRIPVDNMLLGLNEGACRIVKESGGELCITVQSNYSARYITQIFETHNSSELVIVYKGRCIYGNTEQELFSPLDIIGPFRELHCLVEIGYTLIIGSLGYCTARSVSDLRQNIHPYDSLIKVVPSNHKIVLTYEDHRLELHTISIP